MTAPGLLETLRSRGVQLTADGTKLRYRAPAGVLTPALRLALVQHKVELLKILRAAARDRTDPAPYSDGGRRDSGVRALAHLSEALENRLPAEQERLEGLAPDSTERTRGEHEWHLDLLEYEAACELLRAIHGQPWDRDCVELAILARIWRNLDPVRGSER